MTLIAVGLGSEANARSFANNLNFPLERLFADPSGACYKALGFSEGFGAGLDVNPYVKLLPMLAGIGSPGARRCGFILMIKMVMFFVVFFCACCS